MLGTTKIAENEPFPSLTTGLGVSVRGEPFKVAEMVSNGPKRLPVMVTFVPDFTEIVAELPKLTEIAGAFPVFVRMTPEVPVLSGTTRAVLAKTASGEIQRRVERIKAPLMARRTMRNIAFCMILLHPSPLLHSSIVSIQVRQNADMGQEEQS